MNAHVLHLSNATGFSADAIAAFETIRPVRVDAQSPTPDGRFRDVFLYFTSKYDLERATAAAALAPGFHVVA